MTVSAKSSKNGRTQERNGHAPASCLAAPPLDAVSTATEPKPTHEDKPATDGRTAKGTFAPGNQFARGNPNARRMAALRSALLECLTEERLKALGAKLYELAMAGDLAAAKLLLAYAIGKAPEAVDADRLDLDEWAVANAAPTVGEFLRAFVDSMRPADALAFRARAHNGVNDPRELLERLNGECDKQGKYDPPGPLTRQILDERNARIGK